ncbi:unnamed protein product, partial [Trichogramma brassicae]
RFIYIKATEKWVMICKNFPREREVERHRDRRSTSLLHALACVPLQYIAASKLVPVRVRTTTTLWGQDIRLGDEFPLIEFVVKTGYKDDPLFDENGKPSSRRTTAVHQMMRNWHSDTVRDLFKIYDRFDVNYTDELGRTHFHAACKFGLCDIVEKFIELGQDPNCLGYVRGDSPLHLALIENESKVAELLLRNDADPNLANENGLTPLHIICEKKHGNTLAQMFLKISEEKHHLLQVDALDKLTLLLLHSVMCFRMTAKCCCSERELQFYIPARKRRPGEAEATRVTSRPSTRRRRRGGGGGGGGRRRRRMTTTSRQQQLMPRRHRLLPAADLIAAGLLVVLGLATTARAIDLFWPRHGSWYESNYHYWRRSFNQVGLGRERSTRTAREPTTMALPACIVYIYNIWTVSSRECVAYTVRTASSTRREEAQCIAPLGMETGAIPDADITASSSFDSGNVGPHQARLRTENHGGAWCPKDQVTNDPREWLEIDLHTVHLITATGTQGRFGNGVGVEYAEAYMLEYWRPKLGKWVRYKDIKGQEVIKGNDNTYLEAKHELDPPIWASKVRFLPYDSHMRTVCMRVELYGCYWSDGIVSYSMPQGEKRGTDWEFFDATYDGLWDGELRRGLGQLTDGRAGPDNFKFGFHTHERGKGWVGWRNDTRNGQPVEIKFEFDRVREFSALHIVCSNQFSKDIKVFSQLEVLFSVGGKHYTVEPITYNSMEDGIFETAHNVTVKLHNRVGRFVKLRLYFAAKWIMVSEISFISVVAHGNFSEESLYAATEQPQVHQQSKQLIVDSKASSSSSNTSSPIGVLKEPPVSQAKRDDPTYMAVVIGVLTAVILLLAVAIFLIVSRHRQRKCFASPVNGGKAPSHLGGSSTCATVEKGAALMAYTLEDDESVLLLRIAARAAEPMHVSKKSCEFFEAVFCATRPSVRPHSLCSFDSL